MTTPPEPGRTTTTEAGPFPPHADATWDSDGYAPYDRGDRPSFTLTLDAT